MQNRVPVKRAERPALPEFTPVPRRNNRHDGWTPERQRAFIEALADTGCVSRAARMVNMAQANCYTLRRAPGAESFRAAWEAALDFGVQRLKDIAFERAIEGQLVPVFVAGKLMGFRRKRNDALLMFCLRHYGQDATGRRTTINYFSTRSSVGASAGAGEDGGAVAEAQTTTVRTTVTDRGEAEGLAQIDGAAARIEDFAGVTLDGEARAAIAAALEACAARRRALDAAIETGGIAGRDAMEDDPDEPFIRLPPDALEWRGELEPGVQVEEWVPFVEGEAPWEQAGAEVMDWVAVEEKKRKKSLP
ncbi:hypothetical protein [Sphingomonas sp. MS122]|uniref:hypothetical protein n=1 Tax=Sphingomonas sp. MS122 TaxID=3412683 RepID=UPI003C2C2CF7